MKQVTYLFCLILISCGAKSGNNNSELSTGNKSINGSEDLRTSVVNFMKGKMEDCKTRDLLEFCHFMNLHGDEILKTLEIVEVDSISGHTGLCLVFYRYSVGAETQREADYFRRNGKTWHQSSRYFSSYQDDPFNNGLGEEGKALLKKKDEWEGDSNAPEIWEK